MQVLEWYSVFVHDVRYEIIAKKSCICIIAKSDKVEYWLRRWDSEGKWVKGEGWLKLGQGHLHPSYSMPCMAMLAQFHLRFRTTLLLTK